jgi:membrane protease YdiL (CAAX protease family)
MEYFCPVLKSQGHLFFENGKKGRNHWSIYLFVLISSIFGGSLLAALLFDSFYIPMEDRNRTFAAMLIPFAFMVLILIFGTIFLHKRNFFSLFNTLNKVRWHRFLWAFFVWFGLASTSDLALSFLLGWEYKFQFQLSGFLILLFISLTLIPLQCLAEELIFRSYLPQGIYNWTSSGWASVLLSSALFVLMHGTNPENEKYGYFLMTLYYISFALFLSFLVWRDKGIEQAWGIHTATNIYSAVIVGYDGSVLQTDALFHIANQDGWTLLCVSLVFILIYIPISHYLISDKWRDSKTSLPHDSKKISPDL